MDDLIDHFRCQYYQLVPTRRFVLASSDQDDFLADPAFQDFLANLFLDSDLPVPETYRQSIMKLCIRTFERRCIDIDERIIESFAEAVATPLEPSVSSAVKTGNIENGKSTLTSAPVPSQAVTVHYFYKSDDYFSIRESPSILVAEGTTGHKTWEAALALGDHLLAEPEIVSGQSVLELGAGTGFLSILASRLGANSVLATDGSMKMVDLIKLNVAENGDDIECSQLLFGQESSDERRFDLILGADITYDESVLQSLCSTLRDLLARNPSATAIISATVRREQT